MAGALNGLGRKTEPLISRIQGVHAHLTAGVHIATIGLVKVVAGMAIRASIRTVKSRSTQFALITSVGGAPRVTPASSLIVFRILMSSGVFVQSPACV